MKRVKKLKTAGRVATQERTEVFRHATIDCSDMTITEFCRDEVRVYSIQELLNRWSGIPDVEITIRRDMILPVDGGDGEFES